MSLIMNLGLAAPLDVLAPLALGDEAGGAVDFTSSGASSLLSVADVVEAGVVPADADDFTESA